VFLVILRMNSVYLPIQLTPTGLRNGDRVFSVEKELNI
jgi:hypothetical protein